tara:strand:+ start:2367 stop:2738 length:372 start_codon:yes stop_codon:yes gene_type:complete
MAESVRVIGLAFLVIVGLGSCIGPSEITIDDDGEEGGVGSLMVETVTTGDNPDPDGYIISLDEEKSEAVDVNGGAFFGDIRAGVWQVTLLEVIDACMITGQNPRFVRVTEDEIANTTFEVYCP